MYSQTAAGRKSVQKKKLHSHPLQNVIVIVFTYSLQSSSTRRSSLCIYWLINTRIRNVIVPFPIQPGSQGPACDMKAINQNHSAHNQSSFPSVVFHSRKEEQHGGCEKGCRVQPEPGETQHQKTCRVESMQAINYNRSVSPYRLVSFISVTRCRW